MYVEVRAWHQVAKEELKVADEVWIATALLHSEQPRAFDFSIEEIMERAAKEADGSALRPGVYVHVVQHCVANRPPNPGRYRMLVETAPGRRRLFRKGDYYHKMRKGSKIVPSSEVLSNYKRLRDWYAKWGEVSVAERVNNDPLLALYGSGKTIWADEHADEYVRRLREGWE